jgi:hypothetical protein
MFRRWLVLIPALALALAACQPAASSSNGDAVIQPISGILASGPDFVDIGPTSVTLKATTTIDLACSVVYGPTHAYGMLATDTDMAGGGHSDHHPLLTGLQPDTTYYARLQGTGADGTLYRSDEYTFHTAPAAAVDPNAAPNLALAANGAQVTGVSSNFGGGANDATWGALSAFDGDGNTAWSSNGDGDDAWVELTLAQRTHVTRLGFWTRTMGTSAEIQTFQVVTDGGDTVGPFPLTGAAAIDYFDTDFTATRLRFEAVTSTGGNTGAVEIEVYGDPAP